MKITGSGSSGQNEDVFELRAAGEESGCRRATKYRTGPKVEGKTHQVS